MYMGFDPTGTEQERLHTLTKKLFYDNSISFSNLHSLSLCDLDKIINDMIPHLKNLKDLELHNCSITNKSVRKLSTLEKLTLYDCDCITFGVFDEMSHPCLKQLEIAFGWRWGSSEQLHAFNSVLCLTRLTSLSIEIIGELGPFAEEDDDDNGWDYKLDRLRFMTNLTSLTLKIEEEEDSHFLRIKDETIFSSLTNLTDLSYRRDLSCNSDDSSSFCKLTNLKSLSIETIGLCHVTPTFIEKLSHVKKISFRCKLNESWQRLISYLGRRDSKWRCISQKENGGYVSLLIDK
jgi:hypothetical protein